MAFNALWIGAPVLCGIGTEDNVAAFQWALDPDGDPNTTDDIPDVINNSWYDPNLDTIDCYSLYVPVVQAMEAAGIAVVFSAGNEGPGPMTITPPHNINLNEVHWSPEWQFEQPAHCQFLQPWPLTLWRRQLAAHQTGGVGSGGQRSLLCAGQ